MNVDIFSYILSKFSSMPWCVIVENLHKTKVNPVRRGALTYTAQQLLLIHLLQQLFFFPSVLQELLLLHELLWTLLYDFRTFLKPLNWTVAAKRRGIAVCLDTSLQHLFTVISRGGHQKYNQASCFLFFIPALFCCHL